MKRTINERNFIQAFKAMGKGDQFSEEGLKKLYQYILCIEHEDGAETELDVIGLCCEYIEYDSIEKCAKENGFKPEDGDFLQQIELKMYVLAVLDNGGVLVYKPKVYKMKRRIYEDMAGGSIIIIDGEDKDLKGIATTQVVTDYYGQGVAWLYETFKTMGKGDRINRNWEIIDEPPSDTLALVAETAEKGTIAIYPERMGSSAKKLFGLLK